MLRKLLISLLTGLVAIFFMEMFTRYLFPDNNLAVDESVTNLMLQLPKSKISGRELDNQFLVHNIALFSQYTSPEDAEVAYVGTSRTKVLRPRWVNINMALNGSANSYNEISYGLLLQAEILRLKFPNLKHIYFESSLLLRRPKRLVVESDHIKYLSLLRSILPLRDRVMSDDGFSEKLNSYFRQEEKPNLLVFSKRSEIRVFNFLMKHENIEQPINVLDIPYLKQLQPNGERRWIPQVSYSEVDWNPAITADHPKVQRLRKVESWSPWDGLFDLIAEWGKVHHINIVFFQPPVRSDLYDFQVQNGLSMHVSDMHRVAARYGVPFIDLNTPESGFGSDWKLFSDEDHLESCMGVILLHAGINAGYKLFLANSELFPKINKLELLTQNKELITTKCHSQ